MQGVQLDEKRRAAEAARGIWPQRVLTGYFDQWVADRPEAIALIGHRHRSGDIMTMSYGELDRRATAIAANLRRLGVRKGDVVSFQLPNWWQFPALLIANTRIGAVNNPMMPIFRHRELSFMLAQAGSKVFIAPSSFRNFDHGRLALQLHEEIDGLDHVLLIDGEGGNSFEQVLLEENHDPLPEGCGADPDGVTQLLFTSGTTGEPKGVMHTSNTLIGTTLQFAARMGLGENEIIFMPSPFAHQAGYEYGALLALLIGAPLIMQDVWDPATARDLIARYKATYTFASTPFLADLAALEGVQPDDMPDFRLFVTSGAPIPPAVVAAAQERLGITVVGGWGMSECGILTTTELSGHKVRESDGHALPGSQVRVVDEAGNEAPRGQEGRFQIRGTGLFVGYLKRPDLYDIDEEGWFDTGDLARMDEEGYIRITGRSKDIIIRGGENIPVVEVENALYNMPQVADCAIVAMPDPRLGERGCVFILPKPFADIDMEAMRAHLASQGISKSYWPERLEIVDEMPRTASGKIQKFVLRERARQFAAS
ncbi:MAG: AMP-binding protein [Rhodobiaceae bacterium]|nr:AMP-binding protein [Rhodobiaceae bacterium]